MTMGSFHTFKSFNRFKKFCSQDSANFFFLACYVPTNFYPKHTAHLLTIPPQSHLAHYQSGVPPIATRLFPKGAQEPFFCVIESINENSYRLRGAQKLPGPPLNLVLDSAFFEQIRERFLVRTIKPHDVRMALLRTPHPHFYNTSYFEKYSRKETVFQEQLRAMIATPLNEGYWRSYLGDDGGFNRFHFPQKSLVRPSQLPSIFLSSANTSEKKTEELTVLALDWDGAISNTGETLSDMHHNVSNIIRELVEQGFIFPERIGEIIAILASTRQSGPLDAMNAINNKTCLAFRVFPQVVQTISDLFLPLGIGTSLFPFTLADAFSQQAPGTALQLLQTKEVQHTQSDLQKDPVDQYIDPSKLILLWLQMMLIANQHPGETIRYIFVDDKKTILRPLHMLFSRFSNLIPHNLTLHLVLSFPLDPERLSFSIKGSGPLHPTPISTAVAALEKYMQGDNAYPSSVFQMLEDDYLTPSASAPSHVNTVGATASTL
ncbi:MAG: hypothetical protein HY939_05400 [Gammaproteobacteria bacterium]|nr:hypothetical protein [Gammaproteobacteria bacterium]